MESLLNTMIQDAESSIPSKDKLEILSSLAQEMRDLEADIADLEAQMKEKNDALFKVKSQRIPDLMDELGLSELKLQDGSRIFIDSGYAASITKEKEPEAFSWLRDNGHGSLIKHTLAVVLKKGDSDAHEKLVKIFKDEGATYEDKESVHVNTLKAFVKEQMAKPGSTLPQDLFGVFPIKQAKIK